MNTFSKIALALTFAGLAGISLQAVSTPHDEDKVKTKVFKIELDVDSEKGAQIMVDEDNNTQVVEISKEAMKDPAQIDAALADLPEETREKVKATLSGIDMDGTGFVFKVDDNNSEHWLHSVDKEQVVVIDIDDENIGDGEHHSKIIKKVLAGEGGAHKVIEFSHGGHLPTQHLIRMIEAGTFTQEDLDKLQSALDAKR